MRTAAQSTRPVATRDGRPAYENARPRTLAKVTNKQWAEQNHNRLSATEEALLNCFAWEMASMFEHAKPRKRASDFRRSGQ